MAATVGNLIRKLQQFYITHNKKHIRLAGYLNQIKNSFNLLQPYLHDAEWKRDLHKSGRKSDAGGQEISLWVSGVTGLAAEVEDIIVTCDLHLFKMDGADSTLSKLLLYWQYVTEKDDVSAKIQKFLSGGPQSTTTRVNGLHSPRTRVNGHLSPEVDLSLLRHKRLLRMNLLELCAEFSERVTAKTQDLIWDAVSLQLVRDTSAQVASPMPKHDPGKAIQTIIKSINMLGRQKEVCLLENWLLAEGKESSSPVVIAVTGKAGIGKTSVATVLYERVQQHFDCHAWLFVSPNPTSLLQDVLRGVLKSISVAAPGNIDALDKATMKQIICHWLTGKKFLLVLDDIPTQEELKCVMDTLPTDCRAKILLTSRAHIPDCTHVLALASLTPQDAFHLLRKRACLEHQPTTFWSSVESEAVEILRICDGLPLAIVTIGGMLSTKHMEAKEWIKVHEMVKEADFITLCYADLHPVLKSCFLYAASFPFHNQIPCKKLQRLWIAEGFVQERFGMTVEEATNLQLDELIQRNMIQVARVGKDGEVETCHLVRPIKAFGLRRSEQDLFSVMLNVGGHALLVQVHRLFFHVDRSNSNMIDVEKVNLSGLYSFLAFKGSKCQLPFVIPASRFKLLCVLELQRLPSDTLPDAVGDLVLLHYLGLRHTKLKFLPKSLKKLRRLQTLDIRDTFVRDLPAGLEVLDMLKHLLLAGSFSNEVVNLATKIEALKHLLTLAGVKLTEDIAKQLQNLSQLQKLSVGEVKSHHSVSLSESISNMTYLRSLTIKCVPEEKVHIFSSRPLGCLEKLRVGGQVGNLLDWVSKLYSLKYLYLWDCLLTEDPFLALQCLPNLVVLSLCNAYEGEQMQFDASGFPKLKKLSILHCMMLKRWATVEEGALRNLETLTIAYCPKLKALPSGLEKLTTLTILELAEMPETFINEARELHSSSLSSKFSLIVRHTSQLSPPRPVTKRIPFSIPVNQMRNVAKREFPCTPKRE